MFTREPEDQMLVLTIPSQTSHELFLKNDFYSGIEQLIWYSMYLECMIPLCCHQSWRNPSLVTHTCTLAMQMWWITRGSEVEGHLLIHRKFENSLRYIKPVKIYYNFTFILITVIRLNYFNVCLFSCSILYSYTHLYEYVIPIWKYIYNFCHFSLNFLNSSFHSKFMCSDEVLSKMCHCSEWLSRDHF